MGGQLPQRDLNQSVSVDFKQSAACPPGQEAKDSAFGFGLSTPDTVFALLTTHVTTNQTHGANRTDTLGPGLTLGPALRALSRRCKEQRPVTLARRVLKPIARRNVLDGQECRGRGIEFCGGHSYQCASPGDGT